MLEGGSYLKLYEYMAKSTFASAGIRIPQGRVATTPEEAEAIARELGRPVAIKSQILAGARGKAGGIKFADTPAEAAARAAELLGSEIRDLRVEKVLVEEKLSIDKELYLGITIDKALKRPVVIATAEGGINIEDVPEKSIVRLPVDIVWGLLPYHGWQVARRLGLGGKIGSQLADILQKMYKLFRAYDAELIESNPLVISGENVIAADARLNIDDDSLFRHQDLPHVEEGTPLERRVHELGLAFVQLDGDIAVMANGAGITMATLDVLQYYGGRPANFLDAGGGAAVEPTAKAIEVLLSTNPKAMLINIFGGITRCDDVANALVQVQEKMGGFPVPVVIRLVGTNEKEGLRILQEHGLTAYRDMGEAARKVVALAGEGRS